MDWVKSTTQDRGTYTEVVKPRAMIGLGLLEGGLRNKNDFHALAQVENSSSKCLVEVLTTPLKMKVDTQNCYIFMDF